MIELIGSIVLRDELMKTRYDAESYSDDNKFLHEDFLLNKEHRLYIVYFESYRFVRELKISRSSFPEFGTSSQITNYFSVGLRSGRQGRQVAGRRYIIPRGCR